MNKVEEKKDKLVNILSIIGVFLIGWAIGVVVGYEICEKDYKPLTVSERMQLYNNGNGIDFPVHEYAENYDTCIVDSITYIILESVTVEFLN